MYLDYFELCLDATGLPAKHYLNEGPISEKNDLLITLRRNNHIHLDYLHKVAIVVTNICIQQYSKHLICIGLWFYEKQPDIRVVYSILC